MASTGAPHPYYPRDLVLEGFTPRLLSDVYVLSTYGAASVFVTLAVWLFSARNKKVTPLDRLLMCWFVFSGVTHIVLEGYFVFTPDFFKFDTPNILAECWKEYSLADSRYVARDPTVVIVEGITAVLAGPGCIVAIYAISAHTTYEHTLQLAVSLGQLYGDIVYFSTIPLEGKEVRVPGAFYFWFYFVFLNGLWVVIPALILLRSWAKISEAFASKEKKH